MADVVMPESKPCQWDNNWQCKCGKPTDDGWCSNHQDRRCVSCGGKASRSCEEAMGGLLCGESLCGGCTHSPADNNHITRVCAEEIHRMREEEHKATEQSRTSPVQRMNDSLGVPLNLLELVKGDWSAWPIKTFYFLQLKHDQMGFFPAIVKAEEGRSVVTTDRELISLVWRILEHRKSELCSNLAHVNESLGLLYPILGEGFRYMEASKPVKILNKAEFMEAPDNAFGWARGLYGAGMSADSYQRMIDIALRE